MTHRDRTNYAMRLPVSDPVRMIALCVISLCVEDKMHGEDYDLDREYWCDRAEISEDVLWKILP